MLPLLLLLLVLLLLLLGLQQLLETALLLSLQRAPMHHRTAPP